MSRTILITGSTGKIGRVLSKHFLSIGDTVIAAGRSASALDDLRQELASIGGALYTVSADLMKPDAAQIILDQLQKINCMPDCLVNNARNVAHLKIRGDGSVNRQDFLDELALDVVVPYELTMTLAHAKDSKLSSVVNVGSQYGVVAPNLRLYTDPLHQSPLHYGVAKAALGHLTKELAVRLASQGIRVNCVAFGGVEGRVDEAFKQRYASMCPMGRMMGEHELAGPVDLLLSDAASAVTGHVMVADGGWSIW